MLKKLTLVLLFGLVLGLSSSATAAETPSALLEKGIYTEETVGDLPKAIEIYQKVVEESKTTEAFAAEAQYRLGQCLLKQKKTTEAEAAFKKLIDSYPNQKEWIAKAKKHIPGQAELKLEAAPWKDGEYMQLVGKLGSGMKIGTFVYEVEAAKLDGQDTWRTKNLTFITAVGDIRSHSQVYIDKNTFQPIKSRWQHSLLGDAEAVYSPGEVIVTMFKNGKQSSTRKETLDKVYYDNEQGYCLFRQLPLTEKYKAIVPIYTSLGSNKIELPVEVIEKATIETPVGKFECYKLHLGLVNQTFWISTDEHHYIVKFEAGGVTAELEQVGVKKLGESKSYNNEEWSFSLSVPSGWYFFEPNMPEKKESKGVYLLDPDATAVNFAGVWKRDDLKKDENVDAKKSVKIFTDEAVAYRTKELKDYKSRKDSWKEFTVGGLPAVSVIGDYVEGNQKKCDYSVHVLGQTTKSQLRISSCDPDKLDALRAEFDKIVDTLKIK